jgi:hypothetical protein
METEGSLPVTCPYPASFQQLSSNLLCPTWSLSSDSKTKIVFAFFICPTRAKDSVHLILIESIFLNISDEKYQT